jgi:hypothetical protein
VEASPLRQRAWVCQERLLVHNPASLTCLCLRFFRLRPRSHSAQTKSIGVAGVWRRARTFPRVLSGAVPLARPILSIIYIMIEVWYHAPSQGSQKASSVSCFGDGITRLKNTRVAI